MSLTPVEGIRGPQKPFCDAFEAQVDLLYGTLSRCQFMLSAQVGTILSILTSLASEIESTEGEVSDFLGNINDTVAGALPNFQNVDEVLAMMNACNLIKTDFQLASLNNIINSLTRTITGALLSAFSELAGALETIVEYPAALAIYNFEKLVSNLGLPDLVLSFDQTLTCIDAICKRDISSKIEQVDNLLADVGLSDTGTFDRGVIFNQAGLSITQQANINNIITELEFSDDIIGFAVETARTQIAGVIQTLKAY